MIIKNDVQDYEGEIKNVFTSVLPSGTLLHSKNYTYEIKGVLGQGSFGITYLANLIIKSTLGELNSSIQVAVKEFFMKDINGRNETAVTAGSKGGIYDKYKEKFKKESLHLSELKHPNIVKVLEAFEENNTYYYSMEFVEGMSHDAYIKQSGRIPLVEAVSIVNDIGNALSFMHQHNMLHLDLKPLNVMRRKNGDIILIDFGLSKQYDEYGKPESSTTVGGGTPGYAPLEQATYHDGKGFPVTMDVYALAASFYKMLTGKTPQDASEVLNEGLDVLSLQEANISNQVISIIENGMNPIVKKRILSVHDFLQVLSPFKVSFNGYREKMIIEVFGGTNVGLELLCNCDDFVWGGSDNEDFFIVCDGLAKECNQGNVASKYVVNTLSNNLRSLFDYNHPNDSLSKAILKVHAGLIKKGREENEVYKSACAVAFLKENIIYGASIGNCRIYYYSPKFGLSQLTRDQYAQGHIIAIGDEYMIPHDNFIDSFIPEVNCYLLLCTDGLTDMISDEEISLILGDKKLSTWDKKNELILRANYGGGKDNITVMLVRFLNYNEERNLDGHLIKNAGLS